MWIVKCVFCFKNVLESIFCVYCKMLVKGVDGFRVIRKCYVFGIIDCSDV